jgi:hypothetical protein
LIESVNEGWNCAEPFYGPRPQPDYSVGFGRSAFTDNQLEKLKPFVGEIPDTFTSHFMATWQMYFPFLTCEVKCGAAALDAFSVSHDHRTVRIYGHYPVLDREKTTFYRHVIVALSG